MTQTLGDNDLYFYKKIIFHYKTFDKNFHIYSKDQDIKIKYTQELSKVINLVNKGTDNNISYIPIIITYGYTIEEIFNIINSHEDIILITKREFDINDLLKKMRVVEFSIYKYHHDMFIFINRHNDNYRLIKHVPKFKLETLEGVKKPNTSYEVDEQLLLYKYLKPSDSILQLGGNIGTSCILVDKILNSENNVCVEPNPNIINTLTKNKELNKAKFKILDGVLTKNKNIVLIEDSNPDKLGSITKINNEETNINSNKIKVKTYDFDELNRKYKFTVLFGDCEGCLEGFLKEYPKALDNIRLVIFERDMPHRMNYDNVINLLVSKGFYYVEGHFHVVFKKSK